MLGWSNGTPSDAETSLICCPHHSGTLEGCLEKKKVQDLLNNPQLQFSGLHQSEYSDLYVVCQVFANGHSLTLPSQTSYKAFSNRWNWNEWITLPIHFKDIPSFAILAFTIYDISGPQQAVPVGGTTVPIFDKHGCCLNRGIHDLKVWQDQEADGSMRSSTPGQENGQREGPSEMVRLSKLVQKHRKGRMMTVDWLDRLTFREIEIINEREKRISNFMYLTVEFPKFHYDGYEHNVVYFEPDGELHETFLPKTTFRLILDPDWNMDNLVELKHHRLTHTLRKGLNARDLKPNAKVRDTIMRIVNLPPTHNLSTDEKSLIWQFRYYLVQNKAALSKFLQTVSWQSKQEADEALDLLHKWQPLDSADALELLSSSFTEPRVRVYAISRLQCADNEELLLYLLQLVQALRYEEPEFLSHSEIKEPPPSLFLGGTYSEGMGHRGRVHEGFKWSVYVCLYVCAATKSRLERELAEAVQEECVKERTTGSSHSPPPTDTDGCDPGSNSDEDRTYLPQIVMSNTMEMSLWSLDASATSSVNTSLTTDTEVRGQRERVAARQVHSYCSVRYLWCVLLQFPDLASFLIWRACRSTQLASYFYWYLSVECNDVKDNVASFKYEMIRFEFLEQLKNVRMEQLLRVRSAVCVRGAVCVWVVDVCVVDG